MSRRFLLVAGLAYMLILLGLLTLQGSLLALAIPFVVYLGSAMLHRPPKIQITGERLVKPDTAPQNTPIDVTLKITNQGADLDEVLIEDRLPYGLEVVEGQPRVMTTLPAGATIEIHYQVRARRGKFYLQDILLTATDHLGVLRDRALINGRTRLIFLPEVYRLTKIAIRPRRTHGHFGPIPSRRTGSGVDFYGLREYQVGDPRRWINWRTSIRHNEQLFVNQFEQERIADVGIILDARQQSDILPESGQNLFEYSVQAAGSLSKTLLDDGNRVGLMIYGFGIERVFPGYGKIQQERILYALGQARTGHNFALETLGALPTRFFPTGSQLVMVSPLTLSDVPAFTRLRAAGYEILVVSPDPVAFEAQTSGRGQDIAWQIARAERVLLLRRLQRMGIRVLNWPVDRPFEPLVRSGLGRVSPAMRMGASRAGVRPV